MTETETKWSERVGEWRSGGESADDYAQGRGFAASTLRWWASRLSRGGGIAARAKGASAVRMARLVAVSRPVECTLTVRVGVAQVEVRAGCDRLLLRELVDALGDAS